ncbi:hypothetical protein V8B55DRAFT_1585292 [Mucor lusitanicus]
MADPFRVEPKGKSWADIVEEDEQSDLLNSQHEECTLASKEASNEESDAGLQDASFAAAAAAPSSSSDQQADSNEEEQPPKTQDKPVTAGTSASKWASAPSEPRVPSKWQSTSSSRVGSMASKWASAPDSPSRSRYDSNHQNRHDSYSRFGGNDDRYGRNNDLPRNNRWREDPPSGGRLNRSAFEDVDTRNGGFSNKANFSKEKRYQDYHELAIKEAVKDEAPEHKKAIESWNAYKPPAEENEETAKQLVKAASEAEQQTSTDQTTKQAQQDVPIAQKEESKEIEVSPTKTVEPVKPASSSSPSLKPVSSFSWADDIPDDNSDDDDDYPIPEDWIKPKVAPPADTTPVQETSATPPAAEVDIKEPTTDDLSAKSDPGDKTDEAKPELSQPTRDTDPADATSEATATTPSAEAPSPPKEEKPTFTWGALDDYKEPAITQSEGDGNADTAALNDESPDKPEEPVQPVQNDESITTATSTEATPAPLSPPPSQETKEEAPTYTWGALNDYKEPEITIPKADNVVKIDKEQEEAAVAAWNSVKLPEEPEEEVAADTANEEKLPSTSQSFEEQPSWSQSAEQKKSSWGQPEQEQSSWNQPDVSSWSHTDKEQPSDATESQQQQPEPVPESKPTYTWGALDDYKEPETIAHKPEEFIKLDKEQEEAAVAAWGAAKLPEEPEEKADSTTIEDEKPSWNQATEQTPSWNQTTEQTPSWNQSTKPSESQPTETSWDQPSKQETAAQQQEPASEPKPTYTWGALDDYKEPEVIAKPKPDVISISKEDEAAAVSAWNSVKLPEVPELAEDKPHNEPVNDTPSWNSAAQNPEFTKAAEPAWNVNTQESEPVKAEPSWNTTTSGESSWNADAQATTSSWGAVEQPSWSEPSTTAESNTPQQDWSSNSFQEGSSVTSKSSNKDTWRNKLPTTVDDNASGWKAFAEAVAVPPEPAPKQRVQETAAPAASRESTTTTTLKRTEKGSAASKWKHDRYNEAELVYPRPSQRKPHDLSFKLNDFKEAPNNEVHVSWKDIQAQDSPKISIKDESSDRQVTVGLGEFSRANPAQDIVLRLSDITADRPVNGFPQQRQQQQGPQEVVLSFSELNKGRNEASSAWTSANPVPTASLSGGASSGPKEIVCKLSDFARKDKTDGPIDVTLKLF